MKITYFILVSCTICTLRASEYPTSNDCNYTSGSVPLPYGICRTCDLKTCLSATGVCRIDLKQNDNVSFHHHTYHLPPIESCQELNDLMCGPFNREGLLCTKCKPGYGLPLYSHSLKCEKCNDRYSGWLWLLYFLLELVPLTVIYLLVIIFDINATAPPFTAFVFLCHFFSLFFRENVAFRIIAQRYTNKTFLQFVSTLISIWNLDLFRYVMPPFCVSSHIQNIHSVLLEYTLTFYPLFLVVMTYIYIELHARNCRVIILLWSPFHKCFARLKKSINPRSSVIRAFTTFMTLSFSKILSLTFIAFSAIPYYERENSWYYLSLVNPDIRTNHSVTQYLKRLYIFYILFHSNFNSVNTDILAYCSSPALPL